MKRVIIVGAGGHGRAVAEALLASGEGEVAGFVDDTLVGRVWDWPIFGPTSALADFRTRAECAIVAIGKNDVRLTLHGKLRTAAIPLATIVHPKAWVSPRAIRL